MLGAIRKRDLRAHPLVTIRCFGMGVFVRAMLAKRDQTFLALLTDCGSLGPPKIEVPQLVERCVQLELVAQRIYTALAARFSDQPQVADFFATLASQEQCHADLLRLCRAAAQRSGWDDANFRPVSDAIPRLEPRMQRIEETLSAIDTTEKALRLVIRVESSELNRVFAGVVAASDSDFVRHLQAFRKAGDHHIDFICQRIADILPALASECQTMRDAR